MASELLDADLLTGPDVTGQSLDDDWLTGQGASEQLQYNDWLPTANASDVEDSTGSLHMALADSNEEVELTDVRAPHGKEASFLSGASITPFSDSILETSDESQLLDESESFVSSNC